MSFDEQVSVLREGLSKLYQNDAEWSRAAKMLAGIDLDSGTRVLSDEYKLRKCVQIAMLYLEDDDAVNADTFIKKASFLLSACKVRGRDPERPSCQLFKGPESTDDYHNLNHTEVHGPLRRARIVGQRYPRR